MGTRGKDCLCSCPDVSQANGQGAAQSELGIFLFAQTLQLSRGGRRWAARFLLSQLLVLCNKVSDQSSLRNQWFRNAHSRRVCPTLAGTQWQTHKAAADQVPSPQEAELPECWHSALFLLFTQFSSAAHISSEVFSSINLIQIVLHRHG